PPQHRPDLDHGVLLRSEWLGAASTDPQELLEGYAEVSARSEIRPGRCAFRPRVTVAYQDPDGPLCARPSCGIPVALERGREHRLDARLPRRAHPNDEDSLVEVPARRSVRRCHLLVARVQLVRPL